METITINQNDLKKLLRETFVEVLTRRKDLIEDALVEAMEDIGLGMAMKEGRTGKYVDRKEFDRKLTHKIKNKK